MTVTLSAFVLGLLILVGMAVGWWFGATSRWFVKGAVSAYVREECKSLQDKCDKILADYNIQCNQVVTDSQQKALAIYQKALDDAEVIKATAKAEKTVPSN